MDGTAVPVRAHRGSKDGVGPTIDAKDSLNNNCYDSAGFRGLIV